MEHIQKITSGIQRYVILLFIVLELFSVTHVRAAWVDFDQAMGKHLKINPMVPLDEYQRRKQFYKALYNKNNLAKVKPQNNPKIPKIIHQIWLGSPFPEKFKPLQETWITKHPSWKYILWTDESAKQLKLWHKTWFKKIKNLGFKADLLRCEILYQYGGLYIDVDFECVKSFDLLHHCYDFYAGLPRNQTDMDIANGLIGSRAGHPILKNYLKTVGVHLEKYFKTHSRQTNDLMNVVGSPALSNSVRKVTKLNDPTSITVIFPVSFFYPWFHMYGIEAKHWQGALGIHKRKDIYRILKPESFALHYWGGTWENSW